MGVFECQITENLTGNELEDLRSHLIGQCSDGFFEGMEQHPIKTADFGEIYVSLSVNHYESSFYMKFL